MFEKLRGPGGGVSLLMIAAAFFGLAGMLVTTPLPTTFRFGLGLGAVIAGVGCAFRWWRERREARYDLSRLWDSPLADPDGAEPLEDTVVDDAAPYCGWCDEAYAPGTPRCIRCGREL